MKAVVEVDGYPDKEYAGVIDSMSAGQPAARFLAPAVRRTPPATG